MNDTLYRVLFIIGYALVIPALTVFWYTGGRRMDRVQTRSLLVMTAGVAIILIAAQPYR
ncbi:MAG: hypothetical protein HY321_02855 [Armatimonadetes bacterium]|nr:hypothetical protein [Armatimonadota bacterium]